jgi:hypothetical protein
MKFNAHDVAGAEPDSTSATLPPTLCMTILEVDTQNNFAIAGDVVCNIASCVCTKSIFRDQSIYVSRVERTGRRPA